MRSLQTRILLAALMLLAAAVWLELPGSGLAEPDEPRYAEIPREMVATGDWVVPRLNGVPYFEKPPLLYWSNAAAFSLFGESPFTARLANRVAGMGTALLLIFGLRRLWDLETGLFAAVFFLAAPLGFTFSRVNLTDGLLTFFFTATLFSGFAALRARAAGRPILALSALTGAMAAGAFLSKGLVGIVLPGGIFFFWCLATRQLRTLSALLIGPALPVFLVIATPWLWLAERRMPGFLHFFFIREHFERFATPASNRPGPVYYFALVFLAGFLPGLPFFFRGVRAVQRRDPALFFLIWFVVVFLFFSVSRSKLIPYLFPAFPAAAALAARGVLARPSSARLWGISASVSVLVGLAVLVAPRAREAIAQAGGGNAAAAGAAGLVLGAAGCYIARRRPHPALAALGAGWAAFYISLVVIWPRTPNARWSTEIARAARAATPPDARLVIYRTYLQGLPWVLKSTFPLYDFTGELQPWWLTPEERRAIFFSREDFREHWKSRKLVVLLKARDAGTDFLDVMPRPVFVARRGKNQVIANFPIESGSAAATVNSHPPPTPAP